MPEGYAIQAIQAVLSGQRAYCKFLAANDTGLTGGHQAGIYISKPSIPILFDEPGIKGTNKEKMFPGHLPGEHSLLGKEGAVRSAGTGRCTADSTGPSLPEAGRGRPAR